MTDSVLPSTDQTCGVSKPEDLLACTVLYESRSSVRVVIVRIRVARTASSSVLTLIRDIMA